MIQCRAADDKPPRSGTGQNAGMTRRLVLMRHAKSDYPGGVLDHDRPLSSRGRREGALAGDHLRGLPAPIDDILCSTAVRTRQTLDRTGIEAPTRFSADLYEAAPEDILERIRETEEGARTLLVIGHAPGIPSLALDLAGPGSDEAALQEIGWKFPTSALVVFEVPGAWADLGESTATLVEFTVPRADS